jgi:hypothetical protein
VRLTEQPLREPRVARSVLHVALCPRWTGGGRAAGEQNLAWFTPFGRPVTAEEQRNNLIFDSLFFIVVGVLLLVFAYGCLRGFISYLRE